MAWQPDEPKSSDGALSAMAALLCLTVAALAGSWVATVAFVMFVVDCAFSRWLKQWAWFRWQELNQRPQPTDKAVR